MYYPAEIQYIAQYHRGFGKLRAENLVNRLCRRKAVGMWAGAAHTGGNGGHHLRLNSPEKRLKSPEIKRLETGCRDPVRIVNSEVNSSVTFDSGNRVYRNISWHASILL